MPLSEDAQNRPAPTHQQPAALRSVFTDPPGCRESQAGRRRSERDAPFPQELSTPPGCDGQRSTSQNAAKTHPRLPRLPGVFKTMEV